MLTLKNTLIIALVAMVSISACTNAQRSEQSDKNASLDFLRGELALCGDPNFGKVNFGLTCKKNVQKEFNMAIALLHSFEYGEAEKAFVRVIDADPECAMGYWGVAMSNLHNLWAPPKEKELTKCSAVLAAARALPTRSTKESDYIFAISTFYDKWETVSHQERSLRYARGMEEIYKKYPEDKEAAIFYALALRATADPADTTFAVQKAAGALLEGLFPDQPDHPGIAHYLIHSYDYPKLAPLALDAARRYASIAPSSAHAQHMPSHIFVRMGLWDESITSNIASAASAVCYAEAMGMNGHWNQETHALDYLVYAYLQTGQEDKARETLAYVGTMDPENNDDFINAYAFAAMPARYALERDAWQEAAAVPFMPTALQWKNFPWERGIVHFTRVLGHARMGDRAAAQKELAELKKCHAQLVEKEDEYKVTQVHIQVLAAEAWIAFAAGNKELALRLMNASADAEDLTEKHPVTPGEVLPARELLGDLYMEYGEFENALDAYQAVAERSPNRMRCNKALERARQGTARS